MSQEKKQDKEKELYFAKKDADETASVVLNKANDWAEGLFSNGYFYKIQELWAFYHGVFNDDFYQAHDINFMGEEGELLNLNVNHFRNIAQNMIVMTTSTRPSMRARAVNTDVQSKIQADLANQLLEYYMREKKLDSHFKDAVRNAVVAAEGYIKLSWNQMAGEAYDYDEDSGEYFYHGDLEVETLDIRHVYFDDTKEKFEDSDWVLVKTFKNKHDIAAQYPEFKEKIEVLDTKDSLLTAGFGLYGFDESNDIPIYEFYHKKTPSLPSGRYLLFLADTSIILYDGDLPYRSLPIYRIVPDNIMGSSHGYTVMMDLIPIQRVLNMLYSAVATNQHSFAVQNIWVGDESDLSQSIIAGAMNIIQSKQKPEPIQLTASSPETFKFIEMLERLMETISGVNSVARGNPASGINSGAAMALVQSMALQFISGLQQQYVHLIEDVGTGIIEILQDFADTPRVINILGQNNQTEVLEFKSDDISLVRRVHVDFGNPISSSIAGRVQMAENLVQYLGPQGGMTPEKYLEVMQTGNLKSMTEAQDDQNMLINSENKFLITNENPVVATVMDKHSQHIARHSSILADTRLRLDPDIVSRVQNHINEHLTILRETDPALLTLIGEQPLGPVGGSAPAEMPQEAPPESAPQPLPQELAVMPQENVEQPNLPNLPKAPTVG